MINSDCILDIIDGTVFHCYYFLVILAAFRETAKFSMTKKKKLITQALKYLKRFANRIKKNSSITFVCETGIILI